MRRSDLQSMSRSKKVLSEVRETLLAQAILAQVISLLVSLLHTSVAHAQRKVFFRSIDFALHWAPFVRNERHH